MKMLVSLDVLFLRDVYAFYRYRIFHFINLLATRGTQDR